jgi:hypothetical protein
VDFSIDGAARRSVALSCGRSANHRRWLVQANAPQRIAQLFMRQAFEIP